MGKNRGGTARRIAGGLVLAVALISCGPRRAELCSRIHAALLAEARVIVEIRGRLTEPGACAGQARRLRAQAAELRALDVRDHQLAAAVRRYVNGVEALADAYARVDALQRARPGSMLDPTSRELVELDAQLTAHAAAVDGAWLTLREMCQGA